MFKLKQAGIITTGGMLRMWASSAKYPAGRADERGTGMDLVGVLLRLELVPRFAFIGRKSSLQNIEHFGTSAMEACALNFDGNANLSEAQMESFCDELTRNKVRAVIIALGVRKQDQLANEFWQRMPQLALVGIKGTFEILQPDGSRAPLRTQCVGVKWIDRLSNEPPRLWRRYLIHYPHGIWIWSKAAWLLPNELTPRHGRPPAGWPELRPNPKRQPVLATASSP